MSNRSVETSSNDHIQTIVYWEVAGERRELYLREGETVQIGRGSENDIALNGALISRSHAAITWTPGGFELRDLGSRNGTFVNEQIVSAPVMLKAGDVVDIASTRITYEKVGPHRITPDTLPNSITAVVDRLTTQKRTSE